MSAMFLGTTVGAMSLPAFSKTHRVGTALMTGAAAAGGGGGGGGDQESGFEGLEVESVGEIQAGQDGYADENAVDGDGDENVDKFRAALHAVELEHRGMEGAFLGGSGADWSNVEW
jgi:hypothetical protein